MGKLNATSLCFCANIMQFMICNNTNIYIEQTHAHVFCNNGSQSDATLYPSVVVCSCVFNLRPSC